MARLIFKDNTAGTCKNIKSVNSKSFPNYKISNSLSVSPKNRSPSAERSEVIDFNIRSNSNTSETEQVDSQLIAQGRSQNADNVDDQGVPLVHPQHHHLIGNHHHHHHHHHHPHHHHQNEAELISATHGSLPLIGSLVYTRKKKPSSFAQAGEALSLGAHISKMGLIKRSKSLPSLTKLKIDTDFDNHCNDTSDGKSPHNKGIDLFDKTMSTPISPTFSHGFAYPENEYPSVLDFNDSATPTPYIEHRKNTDDTNTLTHSPIFNEDTATPRSRRHSRSHSYSYINREHLPQDESIPVFVDDDYDDGENASTLNETDYLQSGSYDGGLNPNFSSFNSEASSTIRSLTSKVSDIHISEDECIQETCRKRLVEVEEIDPLDSSAAAQYTMEPASLSMGKDLNGTGNHSDDSSNMFEFDYDLVKGYDLDRDPFNIFSSCSDTLPLPPTTIARHTTATNGHLNSENSALSSSKKKKSKHNRSLTCAMIFTKPKVVEI